MKNRDDNNNGIRKINCVRVRSCWCRIQLGRVFFATAGVVEATGVVGLYLFFSSWRNAALIGWVQRVDKERERAVSERAGEMRGSIVYPERRGRRVACVSRESCRAAIEWLPPYLHTVCTMHQCCRGNEKNEKYI